MATESHTTSPSRRALVAGIAAAPAMALPAVAASMDLARLIENHRAAHAAFVDAINHQQAVESAYEDAYPEPIIVPSLLGGGYSMSNGYEECKKHIAAGYENQRYGLNPLSRVSPDLAEQVRALMHAKEAENMVLVERVFAEEEARREAFGLVAANRKYAATDDAENDAAVAICAYPCRTIEEARLKADYLRTAPSLSDGLQSWHVEALIESLTAAA